MKNATMMSLALLMLTHLSLVFTQLKIPVQKKISDIDLRSIKRSEKNLLSQDNADTLTNALQLIQPLKNIQNVQYIGNITVGSGQDVFLVVFDTGSDILWLPSSDCTRCHPSSKFACSASTTCQLTSTPDSRLYGSGEIVGYYVKDTVGLSTDSKVNYNFLLISADSGLNNFGGDGIMGLNNDESQKNYVDLAYDAGLISERVFSFYMDYDVNYLTPSYQSYMTVGYIPEEHINSAAWLPVTDSTYWSTDVLAMKVNDQDINFGYDPDITNVLFDTGTSYILVASNVFNVFEAELTNQGCISGELLCPCSYDSDYAKYPNITFYTRGAKFTVTPYHYLINPVVDTYQRIYYCEVAVQDTYLPSGSAGRQILGDSFLRDNFVGFSKGNQSIAVSAQHMNILFPVDYLYNFWTGVVGSVIMLFAVIFICWKSEQGEAKNERTQVRSIERQSNYYSHNL